MDKNKFQQLLEKYLQDECTLEEKQEVEAFYMSFEGESNFTEGLTQVQKKMLEERMLQKINSKIDLPAAKPMQVEIGSIWVTSVQSIRSGKSRSMYLPRIAAGLVGLLFLAGLLYRIFIYQDIVNHSTGFGQTAVLNLPDGSVVTLNGNSKLRYASNWLSHQPRQVWLEGEAFFSVVHTQNHQKFMVTTQDQLQVEVLGTEFNVKSRDTNTRVVLSNGRVRLRLPDDAISDAPAESTEVLMSPGNLVEFSKEKHSYIKKEVDPKVYISWKEEKLVFDNSTLKEIVNILQETYGLEVEVPEQSLLQETFTGSVPNGNAEIILISLSKSFNLKITHTNNKVIILR